MWGFEIETKSGVGERAAYGSIITFVALDIIVKQHTQI